MFYSICVFVFLLVWNLKTVVLYLQLLTNLVLKIVNRLTVIFDGLCSSFYELVFFAVL